MCEICKISSKYFNESQNMIILRTNNIKDPTFIIAQKSKYDGEIRSISLHIKYCPWCGEDLTIDKGE